MISDGNVLLLLAIARQLEDAGNGVQATIIRNVIEQEREEHHA